MAWLQKERLIGLSDAGEQSSLHARPQGPAGEPGSAPSPVSPLLVLEPAGEQQLRPPSRNTYSEISFSVRHDYPISYIYGFSINRILTITSMISPHRRIFVPHLEPVVTRHKNMYFSTSMYEQHHSWVTIANQHQSVKMYVIRMKFDTERTVEIWVQRRCGMEIFQWLKYQISVLFFLTHYLNSNTRLITHGPKTLK